MVTRDQVISAVAGQVASGLVVGHSSTSHESTSRALAHDSVGIAIAIVARVEALLGHPIGGGVRSVVVDGQSGTVVSWLPGGTPAEGDVYVTWSGPSDLVVHGLSGGAAGRVVRCRNVSPPGLKMWLEHQSLSAAPQDQLTNLATAGPTPVARGGTFEYFHDGAGWLLTSHAQGNWITNPYVPTDFFGSAGMVWQVDLTDVVRDRYVLEGLKATYQYDYQQTTVAAPLSSTLHRVLPPTLWTDTVAGISAMHARVQQAGGQVGHGAGYVAGIINRGRLNLIDMTGATLVGGANNNRWQGTLVWEVQGA